MSETTRTGLPASIELAWGFREQPKKGPKRALTLGEIIDAGVAVASAEGLRAVSMSRVAQELGVATMSLYRYVKAKDELVTLMADAVFVPVPAVPEDGDWRAGLTRWGAEYMAAARRHPWSAEVAISGPPIAPNSVRWMEAGLRCLRAAGLGPGEQMASLLLVSQYLRSQALLESQLDAAMRASGHTDETLLHGYSRQLAMLTGPSEFPALRGVLDAGVFDGAAADADEDFHFGLGRILDGIEVLVTGPAPDVKDR
ncbi:transcriptional regulator, TetR family [Streptomyces sp. WMMB 714]|uniref:TetR/AcrR family transcriptional regulator n=1 Tax=Streptomyces sp. WMMB 714 TaxID=1286822 RepID=UPI0005F86D52|nr:TetR/AcrR family transcriptional regulator [Streptomyces sp. WMMB 714]SCK53845.1 transcriptional regulator, TetR family [Streptomyces sp. WMMB 714]